MRSWIYNRIKGLAGIPATFGVGSAMRVISSGAGDQQKAPFMLVSMSEEQAYLGMPAEMKAQVINFTVWVHDVPGSMLNIDDAAVALKNGLPLPNNAVVGGMSVYEVRWDSTGSDAFDDFFGTNCRPVRFRMTTKR